jgi:hypothetical protein
MILPLVIFHQHYVTIIKSAWEWRLWVIFIKLAVSRPVVFTLGYAKTFYGTA